MQISPTRVAITGAAGFLGKAIVTNLSSHYPVRLMDVVPMEGYEDTLVGSVADLAVAAKLCEGCSDLIIAHMAPNRPEVYATPDLPFDVNVKGTANLFHAAVACGIRRVVLISSGGAVQAAHRNGTFLTDKLPHSPEAYYTLTKALQEDIAEYFHRTKGIPVSILRPAYITDEDSLKDKYGRHKPTVNWQFIDPRDIAEAARLSLLVPDLGFEIFYTLGHPDADAHADVQRTRDRLGWQPKHTFEKYPTDDGRPATK